MNTRLIRHVSKGNILPFHMFYLKADDTRAVKEVQSWCKREIKRGWNMGHPDEYDDLQLCVSIKDDQLAMRFKLTFS